MAQLYAFKQNPFPLTLRNTVTTEDSYIVSRSFGLDIIIQFSSITGTGVINCEVSESVQKNLRLTALPCTS